MKKVLSTLFILCLTFGLMIPSANAEEIDDGKPAINVYDGEGNLIESYDENQIKEFYLNATYQSDNLFTSPFSVPLAKTYSFPKTEFKTSIWVNDGNSFYDLKAIVIRPSGTITKMKIDVYNSSNTLVKELELINISQDLAWPLSTTNSSSSYHSIKLVNGNMNGWTVLSGGTVYYDIQ